MHIQLSSTEAVYRYTSEQDVRFGSEGSSAPRIVLTGEF
jgi:hypothetical protein